MRVPHSRRMCSTNAQVEPLPFVPATWMTLSAGPMSEVMPRRSRYTRRRSNCCSQVRSSGPLGAARVLPEMVLWSALRASWYSSCGKGEGRRGRGGERWRCAETREG